MAHRKRPLILNGIRSLDNLQSLCAKAYASWDGKGGDATANIQIKANIQRLFTYFRQRIGAEGIYRPADPLTDLTHPPYAQEQAYLQASRVPGRATVGLIPNLNQPIGITVFSVSRPFLMLSPGDRVFLEDLVESLRVNKLIVHPQGYAIVTTTMHPDCDSRAWTKEIKNLAKNFSHQRYIDEKLSGYETESALCDQDQ